MSNTTEAANTERITAEAPAAKAVNWVPCFAMMGVSLISYIDRSVLSILSPTILADLHLSAEQYGLAVSAFSICYTIGNPIWGYAIDRAGLYWSISIAVAIWSLAAGAHAAVYGLAGLCLARAVLGWGEGATFPAGLTTVAETLPPEKRSMGLGLSYSGGALGAAVTPIVVTPLANAFGWRVAFLFTATLGFFWIVVWAWLINSSLLGSKLRGRGQRAAAEVAPEDASASDDLPEAAPIWNPRRWNPAPTIQNRAFWGHRRPLIATAVLYGLGAQPLAAGLYAAPLFLSRELHQTQASLGHLLWIPPLGWEIGYLVFGALAGRKSTALARHPALVFATLSVLSLNAAAIPFTHSLPLVMALLFFSMFLGGGFVVLSLSQGLAAQRNANPGFLAGICVAAWSVAVAVLMPLIGRMFDQRDYRHAFLLFAVMPAVGTLLWQTLRPSTLKDGAPGTL